jgi:hypothetical protein
VSLCVAAGGKVTVLVVTAFTLSWEHSVEHTAWSENWEVRPETLALREARVKGSGAGMDPGPGARLEEGWWVWSPALPPVPQLELAASGATGGGWELCHAGGCLSLGDEPGMPIRIAPCDRP